MGQIIQVDFQARYCAFCAGRIPEDEIWCDICSEMLPEDTLNQLEIGLILNWLCSTMIDVRIVDSSIECPAINVKASDEKNSFRESGQSLLEALRKIKATINGSTNTNSR